jgi:hypothetical protein
MENVPLGLDWQDGFGGPSLVVHANFLRLIRAYHDFGDYSRLGSEGESPDAPQTAPGSPRRPQHAVRT